MNIYTVITGDIVDSRSKSSEQINAILVKWLEQHATKGQWSIFRGDSFQLLLDPCFNTYKSILLLRTQLMYQLDIDCRVGIGVGPASLATAGIDQSTGEAFVRSGKTLDELPTNFRIRQDTQHPLDELLNTCLDLAEVYTSTWSQLAAESIYHRLTATEATQQDLAKKLDITQSSLSRRLERAHWNETQKLIRIFDKYHSQIIHDHSL